ncbi:DJ-1/PfpI family protein [Salinivibrio proteolyticus]|uniref:DJ-1/PfpI family protein n=1 Tax=Salinivibrio proteolyticus TaxID=334715 RepID=A0ABY7LGS1_9GAMM|nr:DJ-1/PfpI family protein [Salinivibrio proteolyticus]WBA16398.1 DJ-1/PfpI family protein [Salinivibrio proteolyticus]
MYTVAIVLFDAFTDIDFFLMRDIFGRLPQHWNVRVLGTKSEHISTLGLSVTTDGELSEASEADVVLITSGYKGVPAALNDDAFMKALSLNPNHQLIGSICAGSFILYRLGLLGGRQLTTHPDAKPALEAMGAEVQDQPLVIDGNIATAGGCLSALYLTGWVTERLFDTNVRREMHRQLLPAGQAATYEALIEETIQSAKVTPLPT